MGPSGSGKSTVGAALATRLGARFIDADDLHPPENVAKMAAGIALDDADRMPWLRRVGEVLGEGERIVVACSALRRVYRDTIRAQAPDTFFAELAPDRDELTRRVRDRRAHFMPPSLLESQLATWEPLQSDESGVRVSGHADVTAAVREVTQSLR